MFVPLPLAVGERQRLMGDFTRAMYFRCQSAEEVERRVGYRAGRLRDGYWLMFLLEKPAVDQFEYRGYTHMSGGIVQGHLPQNQGGPTAEDRLRDAGVNLTGRPEQHRGAKQRTIEESFRLSGPERLAKIRPVAKAHGAPDRPDYPPGSGFPQWTLTAPLPWVAAAFVAPGGSYEGNYV